MTMSNVFVMYILPVLVGLLLVLIKYALAKWAQKLNTEDKALKSTQFWSWLAAIAGVVVQNVEATLKPQLVAASKDGVLTKEEYAQLKAEALKQLTDYIGTQGKKDVTALLGIVEPQVAPFLGSVLENAVAEIPVKGCSGTMFVESPAVAKVP